MEADGRLAFWVCPLSISHVSGETTTPPIPFSSAAHIEVECGKEQVHERSEHINAREHSHQPRHIWLARYALAWVATSAGAGRLGSAGPVHPGPAGLQPAARPAPPGAIPGSLL